VSVIVTSDGISPELLRCLRAIQRDERPDELFVADGSDRSIATALASSIDAVTVVHCPGESLPARRWRAARLVTGEVIVTTEARMEPSRGWWQHLAAAHQRWTDARVIGGTVSPAASASGFDRGLYMSEYVAFAPGGELGQVAALSSGNLSYKTADLLAESDILDRGLWDTVLHERWTATRGLMRIEAVDVVFLNGMSRADARDMRLTLGRAYAAERSRAWPVWRRLAFGVGSAALPALLTMRAIGAASARRRDLLSLGSVAWLVWFNICWAVGEAAGYVFGDAER
jgi:hypothetical protein